MSQYMPVDHVNNGNGGYKNDLWIGILTRNVLTISYFFQQTNDPMARMNNRNGNANRPARPYRTNEEEIEEDVPTDAAPG
jgi:hypothetical protein